MSTINISPETKHISDLFTTIKDVEIIPWQDSSEAVGLSLLKDYQKNNAFIPVKFPNGKNDSVAMIRVWYLTKDLHESKDAKKVPLYVAVIKSSRYLIKNNFYFLDKDSPTKESVSESKATRQPVDLEITSRYEFNLDEQRIYDLTKKNYVEPKEVVEYIYKLHIKTGAKILFRMQVYLQKIVLELIPITNNFLKKVNLYFFGKKIKNSKDFAAGIFTPYSYNDLEDLTQTSEKPKISGSDFPITYRAAGTFIGFFSIIYLIYYFFHRDIFGVVRLMNSTNNFFLAILTAGMLLIFDRLIPYSILFLINLLVRLNWYFMSLKIKV